ncbi:class IIb bacteriocin, lactobin A/cerein 7B family [Aestuariibacter salexigens]|nr:class IIb bacteriocin, lactobin A/cerein 7B family [Aestuariibacter salexigens]
MDISQLSNDELQQVSGGTWAHVAVAIAISDAAYDFYLGFTENRR